MSHALGMAIGGVTGAVSVLAYRWIKDRIDAYRRLRDDVDHLEWIMATVKEDICQCRADINSLKAKLEEMGGPHD